jgi:hypothetical protein
MIRWNRDLFRLWLVLSVVWIAFVVVLTWQANRIVWEDLPPGLLWERYELVGRKAALENFALEALIPALAGGRLGHS